MRRREFIALMVGTLAWPTGVSAQQQTRTVHRIGYLSLGAATSGVVPSPLLAAFRKSLRDRGWIEGQNIIIEYRYAEGQYERLPALAEELVRLKVELIVASPTPPALAAKNATETIPIVGIAVENPIQHGLVASLARPASNVTGLSVGVGPEILGKDLELLRELVPEVRHVAVLSNPVRPNHAPMMRIAAASLGLELLFLDARGPDEFDGAFAEMIKERVGALFVFGDPMFSVHRARLADLAVQNRLPSMHTNRLHVEAGGLMCYGPSFPDLWRRAATYVDKILKGTKPSDLPVEQPSKFELVINVKTAKALGLAIPPSLLARTDEVIE